MFSFFRTQNFLEKYLNLSSIFALLYGNNDPKIEGTLESTTSDRYNPATDAGRLALHFSVKDTLDKRTTDFFFTHSSPKNNKGGGSGILKNEVEEFKNDALSYRANIEKKSYILFYKRGLDYEKFITAFTDFFLCELDESLFSNFKNSDDYTLKPVEEKIIEIVQALLNEGRTKLDSMRKNVVYPTEDTQGNLLKQQNFYLTQEDREKLNHFFAEIFSWILLLGLFGNKLGDYDFVDKMLEKYSILIIDHTKDSTLTSVDNTKLEYRTRFTSCLFLNQQENPVTLCDVYQVPRYYADRLVPANEPLVLSPINLKEKNFRLDCEDIKKKFDEYFEKAVQNSIYHQKKNNTPQRVLTILGKPGSGKSSLIQYLLNNDSFLNALIANKYQKVRICRFADFTNSEIPWNTIDNTKLLISLLSACGFPEVSNDTIDQILQGMLLIIDGFDEISIGSAKRESVIQALQQKLNGKQKIRNFLLIVTCRDNYIDTENLKNYITLAPMNQAQVLNFCDSYNQALPSYKPYDITMLADSAIYNGLEEDTTDHGLKDILGIPLILYMIIANGTDLSSIKQSTLGHTQATMTDVYDAIFSISGGIMDHFDFIGGVDPQSVDAKDFNQVDILDDYRTQYLLVSKLIAAEMFLTAPSRAEISNETYLHIIKESKERIKADLEDLYRFIKGNGYFAFRHIEGSEKGSTLTFIHRSMYEYFTASYIYDQYIACFESQNSTNQDEKEKAQQTLQLMLQSRQLSEEIQQHLNRKLVKYLEAMPKSANDMITCWKDDFNEKLKTHFLLNEVTASLDINTKLAYGSEYVGKIMADDIRHDLFSFLNHLSVLRTMLLFQSEGPAAVQPYTKDTRSAFDRYIRQTIQDRLELQWCAKKSDDADQGIENILQSVRDAVYEKLNFSYLDLSGIKLQHMNLSDICFDYSSLKDAQMSRTVLTRSSFLKTFLAAADLTYANLRQGIFCSNGQEAIFDGVNLSNADMQSVDLHGISFTNSHLEDTHMYDTNISGCKFHYAVLSGADMVSSKAVGTNFTGAVMMHVDLEDADLSEADFTDAQLIASKFSGAVITKKTKLDEYGKEAVRKGDGVLA